jgi:pimeloyl-ACP methyl ester carboxylesterase
MPTPKLAAASAFRSYDGLELAYHVVGTGKPLVCLAGGPMRASAYFGDLGGLSAHRQLVMLDLRGTGDSAHPTDTATYRCDRQVADVEALREALGLDRIDVLAHSAGSSLAALYLTHHAHRVGDLVLITPAPRALGVQPTEQDTLAAAELRKHEPWFPEAFAALEAIWRGEDSDENWAKIVPFSYGRWDAQAQAHAAADDVQGNQAAAAIYGSAGAFDGTAIRKAFAARMEPVLILGGAADGWPSPRVCTEYAALFPSAELALQPAAGHFPWLDDPAWFTRTVASFLTHSPETAPAA